MPPRPSSPPPSSPPPSSPPPSSPPPSLPRPRTYRHAILEIRPVPGGLEGYYIRFANPRLHKAAVAAMACQTEGDRREIASLGAFINAHWNLPPLPSRKLKDLQGGYPIRIKLDPWAAAHYYGWDAHTAFEGGR